MRRPDVLPFLTLLALVLAMLGGWLLFPWFNAAIHRQDCVAMGREDCG